MLKPHHKVCFMTAGLVAAAAAHASDYVTVGGVPLRTAFGECVRTGYATTGSAECNAKRVVAVFKAPKRETAAVRVLFGFDQAELDEEGRKALDALVENVRGAGVDRVVAVGYADALGPDRYNQRLSELRVMAVRDYLVGKGVPMQVFTIDAKGKSEPGTTGACEGISDKEEAAKLIACLGPDRRVEIEVVALKKSTD